MRVARDDLPPTQIPIHGVDSIIAFGRVSISPSLLGFCAERGVTISWFSEHGRFLARAEGPVSGNVLLRRAQYRAADAPDRAAGQLPAQHRGECDLHDQAHVPGTSGQRSLCQADAQKPPSASLHHVRRRSRNAHADRDGWRCGFCHAPVDAALRWPHPGSLSIDHIDPNGEHEPGNWQASHLACNVEAGRKGCTVRGSAETWSARAAWSASHHG